MIRFVVAIFQKQAWTSKTLYHFYLTKEWRLGSWFELFFVQSMWINFYSFKVEWWEILQILFLMSNLSSSWCYYHLRLLACFILPLAYSFTNHTSKILRKWIEISSKFALHFSMRDVLKMHGDFINNFWQFLDSLKFSIVIWCGEVFWEICLAKIEVALLRSFWSCLSSILFSFELQKQRKPFVASLGKHLEYDRKAQKLRTNHSKING